MFGSDSIILKVWAQRQSSQVEVEDALKRVVVNVESCPAKLIVASGRW